MGFYTDKVTQLSKSHQAMSTELTSLKTETADIKTMVSQMLQLLQAAPSTGQVPSTKSPQSTAAFPEATATVEGEKLTSTQRLFRQLKPQGQTTEDSQTQSTVQTTTPVTAVFTDAIPIRSFMPETRTTTTTALIIKPVMTEATTTTIPESTSTTPHPSDKGKGIKTTDDSPPKLVPASKKVRKDPDEPVLVEVILHNGKVFKGTNEEVAAALEEDDKLKAELLSKVVIQEVAKEVIKETNQEMRSEQFLKAQANMLKQANLKAKQIAERKQRNYERYVWTMTKTKGEGEITDIIFHPYKKNEPISVTLERGPRVHEKYSPFKPSEFGLKEWDMMVAILKKKKKSKSALDLLSSLSSKYKELEKVAQSLGINHQDALQSQGLAIPKPSKITGKKRKAVEFEPETFIAGLHCNRTFPEGVKFINNKVIKVPEYGLCFLDTEGEPAFQRVSDIHLVETTTLLAYKLMARYHKSPENDEFIALMDKMMNERPDKEILLSKKAKLELMGVKEV